MIIIIKIKIVSFYLTDPASKNAKPHCMKNMMMDIRMRKNWSLSILSSAMSISLFRLLFSRVSMMDLRLKFDMLSTNWDNSDDSML